MVDSLRYLRNLKKLPPRPTSLDFVYGVNVVCRGKFDYCEIPGGGGGPGRVHSIQMVQSIEEGHSIEVVDSIKMVYPSLPEEPPNHSILDLPHLTLYSLESEHRIAVQKDNMCWK